MTISLGFGHYSWVPRISFTMLLMFGIFHQRKDRNIGKTRDKRSRLVELARHRKENVPPGYHGIGEFSCGAYECDFVSPYTKSAQNLDADVMIVLQDWCSVEFLEHIDPDPERVEQLVKLGHDPTRQTNKNLKRLLCTHFGIGLEQTYATNVFPYIKPGDMSADVPPRELAQSAKRYTVPEIKIIEPTLVACLGTKVYKAVREAVGRSRLDNYKLEVAIASPFKIGNSQVWAQAHPSRFSGGKDRIEKNWQKMAAAIQWDASGHQMTD